MQKKVVYFGFKVLNQPPHLLSCILAVTAEDCHPETLTLPRTEARLVTVPPSSKVMSARLSSSLPEV